ncbi:MAG: prepilin-type N-terminal cleavage/methylation domain-containing protein [Candidatus Omnitrophica bacterium]|nr:prepilin-type N-terminal cleavage/methylation domain-containing protein [Candidatus Omnitrophota bacterium]
MSQTFATCCECLPFGRILSTAKSGTKKRGFTLLEVLTAVAVSSLILSLCYTTFFVIEKSARESGSYSRRTLEARRFLDGLRREIRSSAVNQISVVSKNIYGQDFSDVHLRSFLAGFSARADIKYFVKEAPDGFQVYKTVTVLGAGEVSVLMLENVKEFSLKKRDAGLIEVDLKLGQSKGVDINFPMIIEPMKEISL